MEVPDFLNVEPEDDTPSNSELIEIAELAQKQLRLQMDKGVLEQDLKDATEQLRKIEEVALPEAMASIGMSSFTLADGSKITIKKDIYASIRVDFTKQAAAWLDSIKCGGVVKDEIKCNLGRGEIAKAKQLLKLAKTLNIPATEKLSVHPGTLKALVKEQRAKGVIFPEEFFSIADKKIAIIK